jgi:hypothetical protein
VWKADTFKVVALVCVDYGPMDWYPQASIKNTNRIPVFHITLPAIVNRQSSAFP